MGTLVESTLHAFDNILGRFKHQIEPFSKIYNLVTAEKMHQSSSCANLENIQENYGVFKVMYIILV